MGNLNNFVACTGYITVRSIFRSKCYDKLESQIGVY